MKTSITLRRGSSRALLSATACLLPGLVASASDQDRSDEAPPNIVVVFTDDQGWGDLSCYGSEDIATPHIDRLAAEGMRFTDFYASQPVCSASRASLLTGCYANRLGIRGALVGSILTLLVCIVIAFPLGVATAVYLEEMAPKNRFTEIIEININNLAAVPSVVFGIMGLAIFIVIFGMPRSIPLVGG